MSNTNIDVTERFDVQLGPQGRLLIPVSVRRQLELSQGSRLTLHVQGDRLVIERRDAVLRRLRQRFRAGEDTSDWTQSLLEERHAEAKREEENLEGAE